MGRVGRNAKESPRSASSVELKHGFEVGCSVKCNANFQFWTRETFEG